ncbi:uncharacterized protein ccdc142 isoform X1 [Labrus bergylta]|uniref:uncharacterized protein ccdc142 isoform X1 n=1 Tax=Labrus bergylta TaxID=56723 RepID=UPI0033136332
MDHNNTELLRDPGGEHGLTDRVTPESFSPEKEQRRNCSVTEDLNSDGSWSQSSISRSLQRAESLLRSTFNPSLKWLFQVRSQDDEDEGNFVVAHNLVSRSSARLLRLQQALLNVAPQWQPVGGVPTGSAQVCVKGPPGEGGLLLQASSPSLQEDYLALRRLQGQRSLLLFVHEFSRRAHLAAAFISRVTHLQLAQTQCSWSSFRPCLVSLVQELRVHLSHWSSLFSKVRSDPDLRLVVVQQTRLLEAVRRSLDLLALQALVLMERLVFLVLSAVVRSDLDSVPKEVLEDVLGGADLYNQAVGEQRVQHNATQLRTAVIHQAQTPTLGPGLPPSRGRHPAGVGVKELMLLLAERHAERATRHLLNTWTCEQVCQVHRIQTGPDPPDQGVHCGTRTLRADWTWEQLQHTHLAAYITHQPSLQPSPPHTSSLKPPPDLHLDQENQHQVSKKTSVSVELLVQLLVSSGKLLAPLTSQIPEHLSLDTGSEERPPQGRTLPAQVGSPEPGESSRPRSDLIQYQQPENKPAPETKNSSGAGIDADTNPEVEPAERPGCLRWSPSVQWLDLGQSELFAEVLGQYRTLLVTLCSRALWLQLIAPPLPNSAGSINLQDTPTRISMLSRVQQAAETDLLPKDLRTMLEGFSLYLLAFTAHAQWDYEVCRSLGSALKDKCLTGVNHHLACEQNRGVMVSPTMKHFLCLPPPLMSSLSSCQSNSRSSGNNTPSGPLSLSPYRLSLHRHTVSLALATMQLSTNWVMSKSYQFLSSWSLNKFLLVTQGDLKVLTETLELMLGQFQSLMKTHNSQSALHHHHHQLLLRKQLRDLISAVSKLQTFSAVVLKTFSKDCKRMSGEIFEQMMPAAVHWRLHLRTGFPSSPSDYTSMAAQAVIGQVLEGVAPLSDDARVQALSITMTAFMEAWMEHILRHRIKFSVQGALQLKQDFDSIREMIQSEQYGLSADLHHRLLSLRVFQQVDSAVVCLLQQPQAKPCLQSRAWEPFTHCCPAHGSRDSIDSVVGNSITNLRCMEGEELNDPTVVTSDLPAVDPSTPGEPYLAPSAALGSAQQDWLDLRIHSTARRWRLPGLHCLSKSEP